MPSDTIPVIFHPGQQRFAPKYEWARGEKIPHPESPQRAESILNALGEEATLFRIQAPSQVPSKVLQDVHHQHLLAIYQTATRLENDFYPFVFPQRESLGVNVNNIHHAGAFSSDSSTPLGAELNDAAVWSASSAYAGAELVGDGPADLAYALCRPPGHHATSDSFGGYCYFNNNSIAARYLRKKGRVAILDIDFHHGNGQQSIFFSDSKTLTVSIHGDPQIHFPYFSGYTSEIGADAGEGFNLNIILEPHAKIQAYLNPLKIAIARIRAFQPDFLVIAAGFDTFYLDPLGDASLYTKDYYTIGRLIGENQWPTLVVQEGGYYVDDLGRNVVSLLKGLRGV